MEGGDVGADGRDDAGGLVAQGQRLADQDVAVAEVGVVVQVAAAEAGAGDADLEFVGGGAGEVAGFLGRGEVVNGWNSGGGWVRWTHYSQVLDAVQDGCLDLGGHCAVVIMQPMVK